MNEWYVLFHGQWRGGKERSAIAHIAVGENPMTLEEAIAFCQEGEAPDSRIANEGNVCRYFIAHESELHYYGLKP